jgi:hypothetical protein
MSEVAVSAGLVILGPPLKPEACSGARGALKERNTKLVIRARDMSEMKQGEGTYPAATGLCFFSMGTPTFCLFGF